MIMLTDLETSGLPKKEIPFDDPGQPWIVSAAAMLLTYDGMIFDHFHLHVDADGRKIESGASKVHGVTSRQASLYGVSEFVALGALCGFARQASCVATFGGFDPEIVSMNLMRMKRDPRMWNRPRLEQMNVMTAAAKVTKIPFEKEEGKYYSGEYRWPKLEAAISGVLGVDPNEKNPDGVFGVVPGAAKLHNAWVDCCWLREIFLKLRADGILEVPEF